MTAVRGLFESSEHVTAAEFETFVGRFRDDPALLATSWVARRRRSTPPGEEYFPVTYEAVADARTRRARGLDAGAEPSRAAALRRARDSGSAASASVKAFGTGRRGLLVVEPIYAGGPIRTLRQRRQALIGFAHGVFDVATLGRAVRDGRVPGTELRILDERRRVYGPAGALPDPAEESLLVAGRRFTVELSTPVGASLLVPAAVLGGGIALSLFVWLQLTGLARRERDARRLAEAEEHFHRAFEDSPVGMALVGANGQDQGRFLEVNDALCELTGHPREQLVGMATLAAVHPDDAVEAREAAEALLGGEAGSYTAEQRWLNADGQVIWVLLSSSLVRDRDGSPICGIAQVQDISDRKRFEGQLQYLADHDPLTGMFNRRRFEEELSRELAVAERYGSGGAVLALDLDHFKYVNDSLGHSVGDELIMRVGHALRSRMRATDILARLGGDEFAVILPHADGAIARAVAEELLDVVRREGRIANGHPDRHITASIGVALFEHSIEVTGEELLVEADIAMYDAKEAGRDRLSVFDAAEQRHTRMQSRITWLDRIRTALEEDRFVLHAQPIAGLNGDRRARHELLLRMLGDNGDLIPPGTFLYIAERFDLIQEIDRWVIRNAIAMLEREQSSGRELCLEVNLSARSVADPDLPAFISRELENTGADPSGLIFEVTETSAIVNVDRAKAFARTLNGLGCEFALDDFGAGFASFYYLKHLAFDYLKIDGEFIRDLPTHRTNQLVVKSVVEIARGLGKRTIAEYVGDEETLRLVRRFGVDFAQGFYVGRPAPVTEDSLLRSHISMVPSAR